MKTAILACKTLEAELEKSIDECRSPYPVIWLDAGDHNVPHRRREAIRKALEELDGYDTVIMAMSFCGGALEGIESGDKTLILPCCDDCLTLLLGSSEMRKQCADLYLLSEGWMKGKKSILAEFDHCLCTYGKERTRRIFGEMFRHYRGIGLIIQQAEPAPEVQKKAEDFSRQLGLPLIKIPGRYEYFRSLLEGPWEDDRFLIVKPGTCIQRKFSGGGKDA